MSRLRLEDIDITPLTFGTAEEFLCLAFDGPNVMAQRIRSCPTCVWGYAFVRWARKRSFRSSMQGGCEFCRLVLEIFEGYGPSIDEESGIGIYHHGQWIQLAWMTPQRGSGRIDVYEIPDLGPFATEPAIASNATAPLVLNIIGDTGSGEALQWMKNRIAKCDLEHNKCRRSLTRHLPKRVLDVGEPRDGQTRVPTGENICLIETSENITDYICLSHCWGTTDMFKTTRETISERMQCIRYNDLPQTFKDAAEITRELKKRYLWIDSLCIIQNDAQDWREEGFRMHKIYGNSYLTIAASRSKGSNDSLFSISPRHKLQDFSFSLDGRGLSNMRVRQKIHHFDSIEAFPLLKRGWIFQERILSRRVLHFGPQELLWECMETEECECGNVNEGINWKFNTPRKSLFLIGSNVFLWNNITASYSGLDLTKESDVLPALAGIAQEYKPEADAKYLAGIWSGNFMVYHLLWYVQPGKGLFPGDPVTALQPRPSPWRAPSWSWASVRSSVTYDEVTHFFPAVNVSETRVIPAGRDSTGEVIFGELKVSGSAVMISCHMPADRSGRSRHRQFDVRCMGQDIRGMSVFPDYDWGSDNRWWVHEGQPLFCLHLATTRPSEDKDDALWDPEEDIFGPNDDVWFLLLAMFTTEAQVFQRVGLAKLKWKDYEQHTGFREIMEEFENFVIC